MDKLSQPKYLFDVKPFYRTQRVLHSNLSARIILHLRASYTEPDPLPSFQLSSLKCAVPDRLVRSHDAPPRESEGLLPESSTSVDL